VHGHPLSGYKTIKCWLKISYSNKTQLLKLSKKGGYTCWLELFNLGCAKVNKMIYGITNSRHVSMEGLTTIALVEGMNFNEDCGLNFCDGFVYDKH
jgi:hypothetical protein